MLTYAQLLEPLARSRTDQVVVTSMSVVRPWGLLSQSDLDFASADSAMGHAADLALGIALAQPERRVICLNGDGSMLMTLGSLVTIAHAHARNLILFVVENGTYEITGNQPVPGTGRVDFCAMARAAGFSRTYHFDDAATYDAQLDEILVTSGPTFVSVAITPGAEVPISRGRHETARYLRVSLAESARQLRTALLEAPAPLVSRPEL
jgi:thiamine pyrophosphate-dependent acetolactate synthase large subunit-like protein